jgi:hypothetical protein
VDALEDTARYEVVCPNSVLGCRHSCPRSELAKHLAEVRGRAGVVLPFCLGIAEPGRRGRSAATGVPPAATRTRSGTITAGSSSRRRRTRGRGGWRTTPM